MNAISPGLQKILDDTAAKYAEDRRLKKVATEKADSPILERIRENNKCTIPARGFFSTMANILPSTELYKHRAAGKLQKARRIRSQLEAGCWLSGTAIANSSILWCLDEAARFRALASQPVKIDASFAVVGGGW